MAGYSKTPLSKKLGIKAGWQVRLVNAPDNFVDELQPLPDGVVFTDDEGALPFVLLFALNSAELHTHLPQLKPQIFPKGMLWIAWPKKASKVPTDLTGDVVRQTGLDAGLVDVKVCAVNQIWSGLKFVYRVKDRG